MVKVLIPAVSLLPTALEVCSERSAALGARLNIESTPQTGTTISLQIPAWSALVIAMILPLLPFLQAMDSHREKIRFLM